MNETIKTLVERRSVRAYKSDPVPDDVLNEILEAGKYAACGKGLQAGKIVVVKDKETIAKLSKINAEVMGAEKDPFYGAPLLLIVFADSTVNTWVEDGSLVLGNLMNAAYSLGVDTCWIHRARQTFETEYGKELMKKWGLDEKYKGIGNCIMGYRDGEPRAALPRKEDFVIFD